MKVLIGRPINGISINGLEYVCDENGITSVFNDETSAKMFLELNGIGDKEIDDQGIVFIEYNEEDNDR